jgi:methionyl-tRNA formyltransferase
VPGGVDIAAVVTQPDRPGGRGRKLRESPVKAYAQERDIAVLQPARLRAADALEDFRSLESELVVVASYGQILPPAVLDEPRYGCLNLHPSLLPKYRGPSPISASILAGDKSTGTTVMLMNPTMDGGDIVAQEEASIGPEETAGELEARLATVSAELLLRVLPDWLAHRCKPTAQDDSEATFTSRISKADGAVDWLLPAVDLSRRVRAFNPWPVAYTLWKGRQIRILRARAVAGKATPGRVMDLASDGMLVGAGDGVLAITELQLPGGRPLPAETIVRGHPELLGSQFGSAD